MSDVLCVIGSGYRVVSTHTILVCDMTHVAVLMTAEMISHGPEELFKMQGFLG